MAKINIRESLGRRDLSSDNKYDLRNTYDSLSLSESKKKQLAKALYENKSNKVIYSILNESLDDAVEKYFCLMQYEPDSGENGMEGDNFYFIDLGKFASVEDAEAHWRDSISRENGMFVQEITKADYDAWAAELELENEYNSTHNASTGAFGESLNRHQLCESAYIKQFSRYSREYEKLDRLATFLTAMSPNKYYYYVEDTYFDFGQNWWWTTVIAKRNKNGRWDEGYQALSPRAQEAAILSQSDEELESLARQILASDFCPDKKSVSEDMSSENSYGHIDKTYWKHLSDESLLSWWDRASKGAGPEAKFDDEIFDELRARGLIDDSGFINNPLGEAVTEAFDADRVQKRIACTTEFDNGRVFHNDYFRASSAEAEEMARQKSIENPGKVFYVKYDNVMEPCSDIKWKNGQKINESYNVKFYQIFEAPKKPTENGRMIGQRGDLNAATNFGMSRCGKANFLVKAVCDDGKVRDVDLHSYFNESKPIKEDFDDNDFDEDGVEEGNRFFADGKDYTWDERIAGPIHIDFDNWAVWSAVESVNILDYATEKPDGGYDIDKDAFMKAYMDAPVVYFVVDEDTGFIDWGPCDTDIEAKDFLNGKQDDWDDEV